MTSDAGNWWSRVVEEEMKSLIRQQDRKWRPINMPREFEAIVKSMPTITISDSIKFLDKMWNAYVEKERDAVFVNRDVELAEAYAMVKGGISSLYVTAVKTKESNSYCMFPYI